MTLLETLRRKTEKKGLHLLRLSVGLVFFWFGFLKFFGQLSPAEEIASKTISWLSLDAIGPQVSMPLLAVLECLIGLGILTRRYMEYVIPLLYLQMAGALLPLFVFRELCWQQLFVPTLLGQYIIKNAVLIASGTVLGAMAKGGKLIVDPQVAARAKAVEEQKEAHRED